MGGADKGINYNTYALGREGFISMNLVSDVKSVEAQKPMAAQLLAALEFNDGKRFSTPLPTGSRSMGLPG